jgi:hypothetical protein
VSNKVQAAKQPEEQGATQEKQGTTTRCKKVTNNKVRKQQGATQEEQGTTSKVARRKKNDGKATRREQPSNKSNKV